jgi:hypothetical protein
VLHRSAILALAASVALAGCLGWQGQTGKAAISPPGIALRDPPPRCRATLRGRLWPPSDQPTFAVGRRRIAIDREGELVGDTETDARGRFEARVDRAGGYALTFSSETHHATVGLKVEACSTRAVELVAHRL